MKLLLAFLILLSSFGTGCYALDAPYIIVGDNVWLLSEENERVFLLPKSYYVPIVGMDDSYYRVSFNGVSGKVTKSTVSVTGYDGNVSGTTQTLYISEKYSSFTGLKIRTSPEKGAEGSDAFVPVGEPFTYLGSYPTENETWYYVCYADRYGYVPADFCDKTVEVTPFVPEKKESVVTEGEEPEEIKQDDSLVKILVVSGVAVTVVILLLVLILPKKGKRTRYYYET